MSNDILSILSALGKINIEKFKKIYDILLRQEFGEDEEERLDYPYFNVLNDLEMLGHCEIDYISREIYVCPPSFALLPSRGIPKVVLAGGRSEKVIDHLYRLLKKNPDKLSVTTVDSAYAKNTVFPSTIYIEAKNQRILERIAEIIGAEGNFSVPACWTLLAAVPSIQEVMDSLKYNVEAELNWKKNIFCNIQLQFRQFHCSDKVKLINYTNPISQQQQTWIWNGKQAAKIDRNWGRYVLLAHYKIRVLLFDEINQSLAVPTTVPLPKELAKASALCSGYLPRDKALIKQVGKLNKGIRVTVYEGISNEMAVEISKKLGQNLVECHL
ncbi:hypothetical protein [Bacillus multifaciens]|uniref:hypothetical protein n=1 Tax=Bacillus multifaciens TaxID=3068506 RepID=UPI0027417D4A|nr:hypothetical protein [Bacillus sp. WLY-B-L8]MDP7980344.1 hypothetical protein [Bacillus sp. WLY-B-L8]